ncbi:MAG TPA: ATP-binding protein [Candidatus Limnocylindrales bacterium]
MDQVDLDRLLAAFDGMFEGVWLVGPDQCTTYANEAMARLMVSTPAELKGRRITDFVDEPIWTDFADYFTVQHGPGSIAVEVRFRRDSGADFVGLVAASPIATHEGVSLGLVLNVRDLAAHDGLDAQTAQAQRLEAIGLFAAGIVHDFNNMLTAIRGFAELAAAGLREDDPIRDDLDLVLSTSERASAVARHLLAFTRRQAPVLVDVDPAQVITDLAPLLGPMMGEDIDVALDLNSDHGWIRIDPTQFEQVVVNLAVNARDAMPAGGTVTIKVEDTDSCSSNSPDGGQPGSRCVRISVSDKGTGMDEQTKDRIFEPFFTTKAPGKGTGLGLATVIAIVTQSGGVLHVESSPGMGSTFQVDLPRIGRPALPRPRILAEAPSHHSGVVLLVEDDASVRRFASRTLEAAGYSVLAAENGEDALRASGRWGEEIDVLLTDIAMPGIHGVELAARITKQRPNIVVVFASGYGPGAMGPSSGLTTAGAFLPKPYSVASLTRAVERAMGLVGAEAIADI